jgi:cell division protein FtsB
MKSSSIRRFAVVLRGEVLYCLARVALDDQPKIERRRSGAQAPAAMSGQGARIVRWLLVFVATVILVDAIVGDRGLLATVRARHEYDQLAATISSERAENARLAEEARRLKEDPSAIEEIARRELGLIRPGEKVFIVTDVPPAKP